MQDLIDVATNNALGLKGTTPIVINIIVNNDVDNINIIAQSTSQIKEESIINVLGRLFQRGMEHEQFYIFTKWIYSYCRLTNFSRSSY